MCEEALPQTSIWVSSSVRSKVLTHLHEYAVYGHVQSVLYIIASPQQSECQPAVNRSCFEFPRRITQTGDVCFHHPLLCVCFIKPFFLMRCLTHRASQLIRQFTHVV